jgi:hypothetical protein
MVVVLVAMLVETWADAYPHDTFAFLWLRHFG